MDIHCTIIAPEEGEEDIDPAIMYLHDDYIDIDTERQIKAMLRHRCLTHIRVMPDGHAGNGCCIGFTAKLETDNVVPAYVGGDIGCGILTYPLKKKKLNLKRIESLIRDIIPMGEGRKGSHVVTPVTHTFLDRYLSMAQPGVNQLCMKYGHPTVKLDYEYFTNLCTKIGADVDATLRSFGTVGSGNHFIEVNLNEDTGQYYLTIHSGSRGFGMKMFEYHNSKVDHDFKCLMGPDTIEYFMDLACSQYLAKMNRHIMLQLILREIDVPFIEHFVIESTHNYVDFGDSGMILRKGAISARENEDCVIALNMRDGIALGKGLGNPDWNYSCAHGCGRAMTRSEAKRRIKLKDFKREMQEVVSTCVCEGTLDEAPQAYKDKNIVLEAVKPSVVIVQRLVSVINLKGYSS